MMKNAVQLQAVRPMSGDTVYDEGHTTYRPTPHGALYNVCRLARIDVSTASGKFARHSQVALQVVAHGTRTGNTHRATLTHSMCESHFLRIFLHAFAVAATLSHAEPKGSSGLVPIARERRGAAGSQRTSESRAVTVYQAVYMEHA